LHNYVPVGNSDCTALGKSKSKAKAITLKAFTRPEGSRMLNLPHFMTIGTRMWEVCQPYAPASFTPRMYPWCSFLSEDESTAVPYCGRKDYVKKISNSTLGNRSCGLPVCIAVPQPLCHRVIAPGYYEFRGRY
jgi:hypothetical protein